MYPLLCSRPWCYTLSVFCWRRRQRLPCCSMYWVDHSAFASCRFFRLCKWDNWRKNMSRSIQPPSSTIFSLRILSSNQYSRYSITETASTLASHDLETLTKTITASRQWNSISSHFNLGTPLISFGIVLKVKKCWVDQHTLKTVRAKKNESGPSLAYSFTSIT